MEGISNAGRLCVQSPFSIPTKSTTKVMKVCSAGLKKKIKSKCIASKAIL